MPALEQAPISIQRSPVIRKENPFQFRPNRLPVRPRENSEKLQAKRFTPLSERLLSSRDRLKLWITDKKHEAKNQTDEHKPVKQNQETTKPYPTEGKSPPSRLSTRNHLARLAGITPLDQFLQRNMIRQSQKTETQTSMPVSPVRLRTPQYEQPIRRHAPPAREARGIFEKAPPIQPVSIKSAENLIMRTTETKAREPIPKEEFKTLHPSERFFSKIPKLKEIPHTNDQVSGSVPESKIIAERNMATPFEIYTRNDKLRGQIKVIRKLNPEALPIKLIKESGEAQEVKADNGRDVTQTLAFQVKEGNKNKYYQLKQTDDLVMRFVEITDKKQIAEVIAKKHEYARKNGFLPDRNKLRQNPRLEIQADQKKRDHFYTWHDMLDIISMQSIQTLGRAHIVCDQSLPIETASLFSKKFIEAYYSKKYEGLSIEERTKRAFEDTIKDLKLEKKQSVATYLVTDFENNAYTGGIGNRVRVIATDTDPQDLAEPPEVMQPEQNKFTNTSFKIGGRVLILSNDYPQPIESPADTSPDNKVILTLQPDDE